MKYLFLLPFLFSCTDKPPGPPINPDPITPTQCPGLGDYDANGIVDELDHQAWKQNFGKVGISDADGNHDWTVDAADYVIWRDKLGTTYSPCSKPSTTTASIDALVQNRPAPTAINFKVFQTYSATPGEVNMQATWNKENFAEQINLSPVAWHDNACWGEPKVCLTLGHGVAITPRHILTHHQHGTEAPGSALQFLRKNGEVVTRWTDWRYETASNLFRILWLTEDLPADMVAPLPSKTSSVLHKPIMVLNGPKETKLRYVSQQDQGIYVMLTDPDPIRALYHGGGVGGDSGKPLFAVIGREMVPVTIWWTSAGGTSIPYYSNEIVQAIDRLSTTVGDTRLLKPRIVTVQ